MAEYRTQEQVEEYLARIFNPERRFRLYPFEIGWLVQSIPTQQEIDTGQNVGMTNLVIDADNGTVFEYPSWSGMMIADDFREAKQTGRPPTAYQIYPRQWRLSIRRIQEDPNTIQYDVQIQSLTDPPQENAEYQLTIDKTTFRYQPPAPMAGNVIAWAEMRSSQDGIWPSEGTWEI